MAGLFGLLGTFLLELLRNRRTSLAQPLAVISKGAIPTTAIAEINARPLLQIVVEPIPKTKVISLSQSMKTFSVSVENQSRSAFISNCKLYLEIINPKTSAPSRHLILDSFTLNPTEVKLVDLVSYADAPWRRLEVP
jgi:hypothetical protein